MLGIFGFVIEFVTLLMVLDYAGLLPLGFFWLPSNNYVSGSMKGSYCYKGYLKEVVTVKSLEFWFEDIEAAVD
jgi:hypothetical protein